mmetsp:Transcript_94147/g.266309  ORF Transcript_94147/g.266309 Transcript_94147/m.266309 type:complete len:144 (+) Transcript_94147:74-505(+)
MRDGLATAWSAPAALRLILACLAAAPSCSSGRLLADDAAALLQTTARPWDPWAPEVPQEEPEGGTEGDLEAVEQVEVVEEDKPPSSTSSPLAEAAPRAPAAAQAPATRSSQASPLGDSPMDEDYRKSWSAVDSLRFHHHGPPM